MRIVKTDIDDKVSIAIDFLVFTKYLWFHQILNAGHETKRTVRHRKQNSTEKLPGK
jgi:hypothetical protein